MTRFKFKIVVSLQNVNDFSYSFYFFVFDTKDEDKKREKEKEREKEKKESLTKENNNNEHFKGEKDKLKDDGELDEKNNKEKGTCFIPRGDSFLVLLHCASWMKLFWTFRGPFLCQLSLSLSNLKSSQFATSQIEILHRA